MKTLIDIMESDASSAEALTLPTKDELEHYPEILKEAVSKVGIRIMEAILLPRLLLKAKRTRKEKFCQVSNDLTLEVLKQQPLYSCWPDNILREVIAKCRRVQFDAGEFVIHQGEPGQSMVFLLKGRLECLKRLRRGKEISYTPQACFTPICLIGDWCAFSQEPRSASIRATEQCTLAFLSNIDFKSLISKLEPEVFEKSVSALLQKKRNQAGAVLLQHPASRISDDQLLRNILFKDVSSEVLDTIRSKCTLQTTPRGAVLLEQGVPPPAMFFLLSGKCLISAAEDGEDVIVSEIAAPQWIGYTMLKQLPMPYKVHTGSECNIWKLRYSDLQSLRFSSPEIWRQLRNVDLGEETYTTGFKESQLFELVSEVPIIKQCFKDGIQRFKSKNDQENDPSDVAVSTEERGFRELGRQFQLRLYRPLETVTSRSDTCNKIIIPLSGKLTFLPEGSVSTGWVIFEPAGFTCVISHRWFRTTFASTTVQCLELPSAKLISHLKKYSKYTLAVKLARHLTYPVACTDQQYELGQSIVQHLKTPRMYPISLSYTFEGIERGMVGFVWKGSRKSRKRKKTPFGDCNASKVRSVLELQRRLDLTSQPEPFKKKKTTLPATPMTPMTPTSVAFDFSNIDPGMSYFCSAASMSITCDSQLRKDASLSVPSAPLSPADVSDGVEEPTEEVIVPRPPPAAVFDVKKRLYPGYLQHPPLRSLLGNARRPQSAAMAAHLRSTSEYITQPVPHVEPIPALNYYGTESVLSTNFSLTEEMS
eukprot:TRINITY_DN18388_c0_g1_i1.p1 TRINITY_DN18388_c0_g1~~TRINITY_DN18388_c0_g1_i1.p1  ORF type:complete len:762 (+),score=117.46 TRINITY_DN18388_c0_g1_i1:79-2364(+)